ncbi:branched-chain amino acid ABC transporter permease [Amylibacter sp. SFDW26]|uniref:branched-chain amino acid ABC transporter permease n=1 Tax=Amylibacter sp. SFDW26 TaxID=2652722 RepID=UPI0012627DFE|nr:branched-chain amino acid ABC transporter permease [Amylibacter sp. SFDW26]KAB7614705.1 branched-chain amino acid ABC transporter permease [Amylibacter sp. SFDW26]
MDAIFLQILNGLDKGSAYALIALGLTLIFGTLGVVNFAHGALFMIGSFCAVTLSKILTLSTVTLDPTKTDFLGNPLKVKTPYVVEWFGESTGNAMIDWSVPLAILFAIPVMLLLGWVMERGLIKHFYKRPHADQILVTFGLAIVIQEIVKATYGANPIPTPAPDQFVGSYNVGALIGLDASYPYWRMIYFGFSVTIIAAVFSFLKFTTFGMVVRAGMADRETVGMLGINIDKRFTIMFGVAAAVAGLAGVMYTPINSPNYHQGMDFLVLSFVVVVVGGMGSLPGAVLAGFLLGTLESFASMNEVKGFFEALYLPSIDQIIIYLVAIIILLTRPRGLLGRAGVMEE